MSRKKYEETADDSVARWIGRGFGGLLDLVEQWPARGLQVSGDALHTWEKEYKRMGEILGRLKDQQQQ